MLEILEHILELVVEYGALLLEFTGVCIMLFYGINGAVKLAKRDKLTPLYVGKGISQSLEFLMCAEVLKTVTANCPEDYIGLAVSVALRAAMSVLIHWETVNEKKEIKEEEEENEAA